VTNTQTDGPRADISVVTCAITDAIPPKINFNVAKIQTSFNDTNSRHVTSRISLKRNISR